MALSDKGFVDKINSCLTGNLSNLQNAQLADSIPKISSIKVDSVATFAALPVASENTGRMVFVVAEDVYYYSDGVSWTKDLTSNKITQLWIWGDNQNGKLGDGTTVNKSSPVSVVGGFTDWCQVSAGNNHTAALRGNGTLWSWGNNSDGRLGDGTTVNKSSPVSVIGGFTNWCQVSAGQGNFTAAIRTSGTLWAWGSQGPNSAGALGDGTTVAKSSPVSVIGGFTDWCQVSAGGTAMAAVRTNCTLWAWGENSGSFTCGQLGDGTIVNRCSPVSVIGGFTDWCGVSMGSGAGIGIRLNGTIWTWGLNRNGVLGTNSLTDTRSPVSVVGGFTDWCQVSAGATTMAAVRANGTLWAWGNSNDLQIGDGTGTNRSSPVSVVGGFTDWCRVSVGDRNTMALRTNGTLWIWGKFNNGALGDNTSVDKCSPVSIVGGLTDWVSISSGNLQNAALRFERGF